VLTAVLAVIAHSDNLTAREASEPGDEGIARGRYGLGRVHVSEIVVTITLFPIKEMDSQIGR
jgi:hypothetical protein